MKTLLEFNNSCLGFTDGKTAVQSGRIEKILDKKFRWDGFIAMRKDAVLCFLQEGLIPEIGEYTNGNGNKKTCYKLTNEKENYYREITKTEYDFAKYLIDNNLVVEENVRAFIEQEKEQRDKELKAEAERIEREAAETHKKVKEQEEFNSWLQSESEHFSNHEWIEIKNKIFEDVYGFRNSMDRRLLVCIENIENPCCREWLKSALHKDNKGSRKTFEHVTGLKLPKTYKETVEFLDCVERVHYKECIPYKNRSKRNGKKDENIETFYIYMKDDYGKYKYAPVAGEKVVKYGLNMFIQKCGDRYILSSVECGLKFVSATSKKKLFEEMEALVDNRGIDYINNAIEGACKQNGYSPYCK